MIIVLEHLTDVEIDSIVFNVIAKWKLATSSTSIHEFIADTNVNRSDAFGFAWRKKSASITNVVVVIIVVVVSIEIKRSMKIFIICWLFSSSTMMMSQPLMLSNHA